MYIIKLCKLDTTKPTKPGEALPIKREYPIATAETEPEALKKSQYYSRLYQQKGLYNVLTKPSHIVTYCNA